MHFRISQALTVSTEGSLWRLPKAGSLRLCHRVHAAGDLPNDMNRFLLSNTQEVLFAN